jgi:hypothetical protein
MDLDKLLVSKLPKILGKGYGFMHTHKLKFMMRFQKVFEAHNSCSS